MVKSLASGTITYIYDAFGRLASEYDSTQQTPQCVTCYLFADNLGGTRLVTDETGIVVSRHDFLPFGAEITGLNGRSSLWGATDSINQKFTGKERDLETNFDYFLARGYGYNQGRFTSPDWSAKAEPVPWEAGSRNGALEAQQPVPGTSPSPSLREQSKEYVYLGGQVVAIENN